MFITSRLARHVCVLLGYLYPALASAKAAVQQDPAAFTQWMTYWVVMSVFALAEGFVDFFVSWVPFYFEAKIVLIVWLTLPRYQGASQIYQRFLHPYLEQYEGDIDTGLEEMRIQATRRIQSLGASAATEIAKAVKRQGFSAKDQLFTRMLGMAAAVGASTDVADDSSVGQSSPSHDTIPEHEAGHGQRPGRRDERGATKEGTGKEEEEQEIAAANATMLLDFTEVMKGGLFVEARSGEDAYERWLPREIRMVEGNNFCMLHAEGMDVESDSEEREEERFKVLAVAPAKTDRSLLLLLTDQGSMELSLPGGDDRDTLLAGFELLLASAVNDESHVSEAFAERASARRSESLEQRESKQWEHAVGQETVGNGVMMESENESDDNVPPAAMTSRLRAKTGAE
ncbi:unnamed protein product [Ascophyllum nodosum]